MAGFGHSNLAALGYSLRPYLNPDAVEEEKKKSSSKSTKPAWQRELIQSAALMATKAKQDKAEYSIRKTASQQEELDREDALKANIAQTQEVNPDQIKGGLDSSLADAEGRVRYPTKGRGVQGLDTIPEAYKQAQAATWLHQGTDTKLGDILGETYRGELEVDADSARRKLAGEVMQEKTDIANTEKAELALQEKKNKIARSLQDWEYKQAKQIADEKAKLAKAVLAKQEKFDKAQAKDKADDEAKNIKITALQRKTSLENLKLSRERKERRDKAEAATAKALATAEAKEETVFNTAVDKRIAEIMSQHPRSRQDLKVGVQTTMANQMYGAEGAGGSLRAGSDVVRGAVDDEEWVRMLKPQERTVILDQLWRQAVNIANSKGTSAQNEFNMLSLAISQGKMSPYDFLDVTTMDPNAPTTRRAELKWPASAGTLGGFMGSKLEDFGIGAERVPIPMSERDTITQPDIQVRSEGDLLAALQAGDSLGNHVYQVDGVGAFQWDNATQKFVKIQ
jgi:hypothetical protein